MRARRKGDTAPFQDVYKIVIGRGLYAKPISINDVEFEKGNEPTSNHTEAHWQDVRERAAIAAMQGIMNFFVIIKRTKEVHYTLHSRDSSTFSDILPVGFCVVRERAAIAAMQGIMNFFGSLDYNKETIADLAVKQADTLVEQLKKEKNEAIAAYVVTRCEEHSDYVEKVFLNEDKAQAYCDKFNNDDNEYARDITKIKVTL